MFYIIPIIFIWIVNNNINQAFGCICPNDTRPYVPNDGGDAQANGGLKCYYVPVANSGRGSLYCLYSADCSLATDGDGGACLGHAISVTTVAAQGGGGTTTTTTPMTATTSSCKCPATDTAGTTLIGSQFVTGQLSCGYANDSGCWYDPGTCALTLDQHGGLCVGNKTATSASTTAAPSGVTTTAASGIGILTTPTLVMGITTTTTPVVVVGVTTTTPVVVVGITTTTTTTVVVGITTTIASTTMSMGVTTTSMNVTTVMMATNMTANMTTTTTRPSTGTTLNGIVKFNPTYTYLFQ
ncbi:unnamed protein product [Adineta steineri]|uniref:Uncharacterized protein n=2 Tax=Adineta steineri TaxID=433720 RepID=A0A819GFT4_9BILA|nr:unnamed protein product [Adineta steineri]CAF0888879.1 unnamed protein product [Adineta steineri]CAF3884688.1 unnamed protein product [Adineta steineri]CAF3908831.1 unnamed protein product [Adineta steineri]